MCAETFTNVFFSSAHSKIEIQFSSHAFNGVAHAPQRQLQQAALSFDQRALVQSPLKGSTPLPAPPLPPPPLPPAPPPPVEASGVEAGVSELFSSLQELSRASAGSKRRILQQEWAFKISTRNGFPTFDTPFGAAVKETSPKLRSFVVTLA